jgi:hypothetical protein
LLLLLDGAERAALTPLPEEQLHRLAYLANCLSPIYDLPVWDGKIMKQNRGPFYADLQWDCERLVVQGFAQGFLHHPSRPGQRKGRSRDQLAYALTPDGFEAITQTLCAPRAARIHRFLVELNAAFGSLHEPIRGTAASKDANYAGPHVEPGMLIDFAEWDLSNRSASAAHAFAHFAPKGLALNRRDKIHLYLRYLGRLARGATP